MPDTMKNSGILKLKKNTFRYFTRGKLDACNTSALANPSYA